MRIPRRMRAVENGASALATLSLSVALMAGCTGAIGDPPGGDGPPSGGNFGGAPNQQQSTVSCLPGDVACGPVCANLTENAAHCGTCETSCPPGVYCAQGKCACPTGTLSCGSSCASLLGDAKNCGACGRACAASEICDQGSCKAASSGCTAPTTLCGSGCVDTSTDAANCGGCGKACATGRACANSACQCDSGKVACGDVCVDTQTDPQNCGGCGVPCDGGRTCSGGQCSCADGKTFCGVGCVDVTTDSDNCGSCNNPCTGGSTCSGSQCACTGGLTFCDGTCVDVQTSLTNCGGCGHPCATGEQCSQGRCEGPLGADGCSGSALGITVSQIAAYQSIKIPVMNGGAEVATGSRVGDVVEGRETMVRVFTTLSPGFSSRELSARLTITNGGTSDQYFAKRTVSGDSADADLGSTFQIFLPPDKVKVDATYSVELVECATGSGTVASPRFPASGETALGVRRTGSLKINIVPVNTNSRNPDTSDSALSVYRALMMAMYPTDDVVITVGTGITTAYPINWSGMLDQIRSLRQSERPASDVYYYGFVKPEDTLRTYCQSSCTAGIGYVGGETSANSRAAVGLAFADETSARTMAHEVGHNHGRNHAPCAPGTINGVDAAYPYAGGITNTWGYDQRTRVLLDPVKSTDIMGYCNSKWLSDYTYRGLTDRVASVNGNFELFVAPEAVLAYRVLLVDGTGARWGIPFSSPDAPSGAPETAVALDGNGHAIGNVTVYRTEISDIGAWSILIPPPEPGFSAIQVSGAAAINY